jgi:hypothetical protein
MSRFLSGGCRGGAENRSRADKTTDIGGRRINFAQT